MSLLIAILLGIIQGVTEFLPVSSSGHLKLFQQLFGLHFHDELLLFDLICHLGTLAALLIALRHEIGQVLRIKKEIIPLLLIATLPLIPLSFCAKEAAKLYSSPALLGPGFLITALFLALGEWRRSRAPIIGEEGAPNTPRRDALLIGLFQAAALFPGVSRSGSTLSGASLLGWSRVKALHFSFLLAIPAILGATLIQGVQVIRAPTFGTIPWMAYLLAFLASLFSGLLTARWFLGRVGRGSLRPFAWYCLLLGLFTLIWINCGNHLQGGLE